MNYISFSLWGTKPFYNQGAIENAKLAREIYPNWKMVVFHSSDTPKEVLEELTSLNCLCLKADESFYGMFWRFFALDLQDADYVIFRDADSRLSVREKFAVDEWISSNKSAHCIRDHPLHKIPFRCDSTSFLGGMWGIKNKSYPLTNEVRNSSLSKSFVGVDSHNLANKNSQDLYGFDQKFLESVYKFFHEKDDVFIHDEFGGFNKINHPRENFSFIGERINIDNTTATPGDRKILENWYHGK
tara:strand:- start:372 stop:1100 length:729 start_codon:yes stop_codon:yes gene_type:complete